MKRIEQNPPRWLQNRITLSMREVARIKRELRGTVRDKDAKCLQRKLKRAQIEHAYAQHWVNLV